MNCFLKFIFGIELYMCRTGFLSVIRSLVLYSDTSANEDNSFRNHIR